MHNFDQQCEHTRLLYTKTDADDRILLMPRAAKKDSSFCTGHSPPEKGFPQIVDIICHHMYMRAEQRSDKCVSQIQVCRKRGVVLPWTMGKWLDRI